MHRISFEYLIPESGILEMDIDTDLDYDDQEELALREIKSIYPDIEQIEIIDIKEI